MMFCSFVSLCAFVEWVVLCCVARDESIESSLESVLEANTFVPLRSTQPRVLGLRSLRPIRRLLRSHRYRRRLGESQESIQVRIDSFENSLFSLTEMFAALCLRSLARATPGLSEFSITLKSYVILHLSYHFSANHVFS
jgi:hypothetical protein